MRMLIGFLSLSVNDTSVVIGCGEYLMALCMKWLLYLFQHFSEVTFVRGFGLCVHASPLSLCAVFDVQRITRIQYT